MNYSHTLLIPEITQVQKVKWCMKQNLFNTSFPHMSPWPNWLGVRLQSSNVAVGRSNPTGGNFLVNLFFWNCFVLQIFCQIYLS